MRVKRRLVGPRDVLGRLDVLLKRDLDCHIVDDLSALVMVWEGHLSTLAGALVAAVHLEFVSVH